MNNPAPALLVIFGITGDLAKRKLLPALYSLNRDGYLPPGTQIIGVTRQKLTKADVLQPLSNRVNSRPYKKFERQFHLLNADLAEVDDYRKLKDYLDTIENGAKQTFQRLYYLSIPPSVLDDVVGMMAEAGLQKEYRSGPLPRLLIEKPFGYDLASAQELIRSLGRTFKEEQLYRIDHYLAKEMAQNITDFRFKNALFDQAWSSKHIHRVVLTAFEEIGIENRVAFYEQTGALRDLIQSHLLQLMALCAMERPRNSSPAAMHASRLQLLQAVQSPMPYEVASVARRGQYASYLTEVGAQTATETYAALQLFIDNERWNGVPFILQTGKRMSEKLTNIEIWFGEGEAQNRLEIRLQPNEAVNLDMRVKRPGHGHVTVTSAMDFSYGRSFVSMPAAEAYERVLLDAIKGDQTLFASSKEVLETWRIVQPVLDEWSKSDTGLYVYKNNGKNLPKALRMY